MNTSNQASAKEPQGEHGKSPSSKIGAFMQWLMDNSDAILKLTGTLGIIVGTFLVAQYESRMSAISLINQREQAESELRASMFSHLITPVAGPYKDNREIDSHREKVLVELLALNFHEHFEFKPLMLHVDRRLAKQSAAAKSDEEKAQYLADRNSLQSIARRVAERQIATLAKEEGSHDPFELEVNFLADQLDNGSNFSSIYIKEEFQQLLPSADDGQVDIDEELDEDGVLKRLREHEIVEKLGDEDIYIFNIDDESVLKSKLIAADLTDMSDQIVDLWRSKRSVLNVPHNEKTFKARPRQTVRLKPPMSNGQDHYIELSLFKPNLVDRTIKIDYSVNFNKDIAGQSNQVFTLTWYDFPLTDNTLLPDGNRFSIVLTSFEHNEAIAGLMVKVKLVWYPKDFFTARERPIKYREFREKLNI